MRTHRILMVVALVLVVLMALVGTSFAQCGGHGQRDGRMGPGGAAALKPAFTTQQQEQMEKIRTKYDDQRVELRNKMGVIRLEMRDLMTQPEPDFGKVEAKIDEMSAIHAKIAKLRFQQHRDVRGLLTPDQRSLFDRGFADGSCDGRGGPGDCQMSCGDRMGCGGAMGAGGKMACGGAMGCAAMGAGAGAASCPMTGGMGPVRGVRPQAGEWRRWL